MFFLLFGATNDLESLQLYTSNFYPRKNCWRVQLFFLSCSRINKRIHEILVLYSKCSKIFNTFLFLLQKQSDLGLPCLSKSSGQVTSARNFRTLQ